MKKKNYVNTISACSMGYVIQAIVNNFAPLLFVTFKNTFNISLDKIALLISFNFGIQLLVDLISSRFVPKIGYRVSVILADVFALLGLISLSFFPYMFSDAYIGIIISVFLYAIGGGLLEVVVSPIVEACPTNKKSATMSLLHSFYCWGHVAVVLLSTLFFSVFGIENWRIMALIWAIFPLINGIWFLFVPIKTLDEVNGKGSVIELFKSGIFWVMILIMVCSGASELGLSQWASAFAEEGLNVSKTVGDLTGPCAFAILMGISRLLYAGISHKIKLEKFMMFSTVLCVISYLTVALSPYPALNLIACAICGFSVGIMWPGTYSIASSKIKNGGTAMFAFLALAGDLGCSSGPALIGFISDAFNNNLKIGILTGTVFPILLIVGLLLSKMAKKDN